jgi:uncharacterized protein YjaZ
MKFNIVDTRNAYARLLAADSSAEREAIFNAEIVAPFSGLTQVFGSSDAAASFAQWGMTPALFEGQQRARTQQVFDGLSAANGWQRAVNSLQRGVEAFAPYVDRIPLESSTFGLMIADLKTGPTDIEGYTGFGGIPGWIMTVYGSATPYNLERLEACTVHELHHNLWGSANPKDWFTETTVGDYMMMEGLAESFAAELYGADKLGPWVTNFDETRLDATKAILRDHLTDTGPMIRAYIFGDLDLEGPFQMPKVGLPPYTGYAIGYRVVQAYLARHGGSVVDASFVPAEQLIAESGYFE